jgi:hypothetical protein
MRHSQKRFFVAGVCGLLISSAPCLALDMAPQILRGTAELHTSKTTRDVIYGKADGVELKMDIYFPLNANQFRRSCSSTAAAGKWVINQP